VLRVLPQLARLPLMSGHSVRQFIGLAATGGFFALDERARECVHGVQCTRSRKYGKQPRRASK